MRAHVRTWILRFVAAGCAYLLLFSAITGCEAEPTSAEGARIGSEDATVYVIGPSGQWPAWPAIVGGARRYADGIPYLHIKAVQPRDGTAKALSATVAEVLQKGPGAICLYVTDPAAARPAAQRIVEQGVFLITMGRPIDDARVFGHVEPTFGYGAETLGNHLAELADGKRSYVLLHENGKDALATECYQRFRAEASRQYTLALLDQCSTNGSDSSPRQLVEQMLRRFRHAGLVITLTPEPWLSGAVRTVLSDENRFATLGAFPQLWPHLRSGRAVALVGPLDGEIGHAALELVAAALTKSRELDKVRVVLTEVVTAETLDDFARRYAAAAGLDPAELLSGSAGAKPVVAAGDE